MTTKQKEYIIVLLNEIYLESIKQGLETDTVLKILKVINEIEGAK